MTCNEVTGPFIPLLPAIGQCEYIPLFLFPCSPFCSIEAWSTNLLPPSLIVSSFLSLSLLQLESLSPPTSMDGSVCAVRLTTRCHFLWSIFNSGLSSLSWILSRPRQFLLFVSLSATRISFSFPNKFFEILPDYPLSPSN